MADSTDTVIITGIPHDLTGSDFIQLVSKAGEIKTAKDSGQRLAIMRRAGKKEKEGIVTYVDKDCAKLAVKILDESPTKESSVKVITTAEYFSGRSFVMTETEYNSEDYNMAWLMWMEKRNDKKTSNQQGCFSMFRQKREHVSDSDKELLQSSL